MFKKKNEALFGEKNDGNSEKTNRVRTINIVLAFVMAVSLWAYVIGEVNPETEKTITGVELNVVGEKALEEQGLTALTEFDNSISVIIKGRRNNIYDLVASKLSARIDVSECTEGENQVEIKVTAPDKVSEAYAKDGSVVVIVDKIVEESKNIDIAIGGKKNSGTDVEINSMSYKSVKVSGPSTYVARVDSVVGVLNVKDGEGSYNQTVTLTAVDKDGNEVEGVKLDNSSVNVIAEETLIKSITVPVQVIGKNEAEYIYHIPESVNVYIKGNYSKVESITELEAIPLDLTGIIEDSTMNMEITIPAGITAVDSEGNTLTVDNDNIITSKVEIKIEKKDLIEGE